MITIVSLGVYWIRGPRNRPVFIHVENKFFKVCRRGGGGDNNNLYVAHFPGCLPHSQSSVRNSPHFQSQFENECKGGGRKINFHLLSPSSACVEGGILVVLLDDNIGQILIVRQNIYELIIIA